MIIYAFGPPERTPYAKYFVKNPSIEPNIPLASGLFVVEGPMISLPLVSVPFFSVFYPFFCKKSRLLLVNSYIVRIVH